MNIVFRKSNGAVLAASEYRQGATIINPPALEIFPSFNGTLHGSFIMDSSSLPSNFAASSYINYNVDNPVTPTTVVLKYYVELVVPSPTMQADGASVQTITINIKDSTGTLITVGTYSIGLTADKGFLSTPLINTVSGTASLLFYASKEVGQTTIRAFDTDVETITGIGGLIPALSAPVTFAATSYIASPLSPLANTAVIPNPMYSQHAMINFYNGKPVPVGVEILSSVEGSIGTNSAGMTTVYTTSGAANDIAKFATVLNHIRRRVEGKASFVFAPPQDSTWFWLGIAATDISTVQPSVGAPISGKTIMAIGVDTSAGYQFFQAMCSDGVITSQGNNLGFKPNDATLFQLDISWGNDAGSDSVTFTLTALEGNTGSSTTTLTGAGLPPQDTPMGIIGSVKAIMAAVKSFEMKSVYVQHS